MVSLVMFCGCYLECGSFVARFFAAFSRFFHTHRFYATYTGQCIWTLVRSVEEEDLESGVWAHRSEGQSF